MLDWQFVLERKELLYKLWWSVRVVPELSLYVRYVTVIKVVDRSKLTSVRTRPGLMTFTRMGARSMASPRVILSVAPPTPAKIAYPGRGRTTACPSIGGSASVQPLPKHHRVSLPVVRVIEPPAFIFAFCAATAGPQKRTSNVS